MKFLATFIIATCAVLAPAAARKHYECSCSIWTGNKYVYDWQLTFNACKNNYDGEANYNHGQGRCKWFSGKRVEGDDWNNVCKRQALDGWYPVVDDVIDSTQNKTYNNDGHGELKPKLVEIAVLVATTVSNAEVANRCDPCLSWGVLLHSGPAKFREEGYAILSHRSGASEITFKEIDNHDEELNTGIPERYLTGLEDFRKAPIAAKMSWMAGRNTAKEEDIAYSMVGLFGLTMTIQYGEGYRAFFRLQEILLTSERMDESIFAWKMPHENAGNDYNGEVESWAPGDWVLLAPSPNWFKSSGNLIVEKQETRGFAKTGRGVEGPFVMHFMS